MKVLGIDVGGSGIKGAPVDIQSGEVLGERHRIETPQPATPEAVAKTIKKLVDHFEWQGPIGCGFPAVVQHGTVHTASNIDKSWIEVNAEEVFSKAIGQPAKVVNDADAAGIAEMTFGAGKGENEVVLLLTLGTGIGSALFYKGVLVPNTEFGHAIFKGDIAENYCASSVRKREDLSWEVWGKRLNEYLNYMDRLLSPDLVILGGGVSKKLKKYECYLETDSRVVAAEMKNHAGLVGAAQFALQD